MAKNCPHVQVNQPVHSHVWPDQVHLPHLSCRGKVVWIFLHFGQSFQTFWFTLTLEHGLPEWAVGLFFIMTLLVVGIGSGLLVAFILPAQARPVAPAPPRPTPEQREEAESQRGKTKAT
mmetsp:Transcript_5338/g.11778  ORF Transcript_5338/g.11778 Transcript_5338/m.11778 type:complete len:119 (-) Transcript_5338:37-393(-)